MPRPGIPPNIEPLIVAESGTGKSQREIAVWLRERHNVHTTHVTIGKLLRRIREEVGESTRTVAVSEIAPQVVGHIAGLNGVIVEAMEIKAKAMEGIPVVVHGVPLLNKDGTPVMRPDMGLALKALDVKRKAHVDVLKIAGADSASDGVKALADLLRAAGE